LLIPAAAAEPGVPWGTTELVGKRLNVSRPPKRVAVVGAGLVGLSTAWLLQMRGVEVVILERSQVGAGASWGNAGWLSPALAVPLPEPATLRAGLAGFMSPSAPLYVPAAPNPRRLRFLLSLARHSTERRWRAGLAALAPLNVRALAAHDALTAAGADITSMPMDPCLIATRTDAQRRAIVDELLKVRSAGQDIQLDLLTGDEARAIEPLIGNEAGAVLRLYGQRHIHPGKYLAGLAAAFRRGGGCVEEGVEVRSVRERGDGVELRTTGARVQADAVVIANGALLGRLARPFGVRRLVEAGRGYSFAVTPDRMPAGPVYFPHAKVVFTPLGDRLRVSGMMEFRPADAPPDPRRIASIVRATRPLVRGVDWASATDKWVGARPCTDDGLPLIGPTLSPRVYVAGGHGMWGITHGPVTGQLLAETIVTGAVQPELAALHPLR
jgi:D-amino-acid dehydrogenase